MKVKSLSHVRLSVTPWTVAYQPPPSLQSLLAFSRQEYWNEFPFLSPGTLPNSGIKLRSPTWQADVSPSEPPGCYRYNQVLIFGASQVVLVVKTSCNTAVGWIPRSGRSPGTGNGDPLKYYCLENPWTEEPDGL